MSTKISGVKNSFRTAVLITFSGNCRSALSFYQSNFGGKLHFQSFDTEIPGFSKSPVIAGSLISERIIIHGSDLVHAEGRTIGNFISIFLHCTDIFERNDLINKLFRKRARRHRHDENQKLIELTDDFDVRWVLGI